MNFSFPCASVNDAVLDRVVIAHTTTKQIAHHNLRA